MALIHGPKFCLDLGSESFNIRKKMHRLLFISMIKGISHQSHINKESLFIEYDIKSGFLSNTESILLHCASGATCDFDRQAHLRGAN